MLILIIVGSNWRGSDYSDYESAYDNKEEPSNITTSADASSYLGTVDGLTYYPENTMDDDYSTAWVEGVDGNGEGEWLMVPSGESEGIIAVRIVNGYQKSEDIYYKNNRVKEAELIFDDGTSELVTLRDEYGKSQVVILSEEKHSASITLRIKSVYTGSEWQDTCVTELGVAYAAAGPNVLVLHSEPY